MRITESKLRRVLRKTLVETLTEAPGISQGDVFKKGNLGKLPVGIDPSRSTVSASGSDKALKAIDALAVEEDMSQQEVNDLRGVVNRLVDCMTHNDDPRVCADKLFDAGLENAFHEIGDILHDSDEHSEINQYALDVALFLQPEY